MESMYFTNNWRIKKYIYINKIKRTDDGRYYLKPKFDNIV